MILKHCSALGFHKANFWKFEHLWGVTAIKRMADVEKEK